MKNGTLIFLCIVFLSCGQYSVDTKKLEQQIISIDKAMSDLASKEGFNNALLKYAEDDFVKLNIGDYPAIGKTEFEKQINGRPGTKFISWEPLKSEVANSGELGYTWGNWKILFPDTTLYGNYFTVWKKQSDGLWKMALDGGNTTPAPITNSKDEIKNSLTDNIEEKKINKVYETMSLAYKTYDIKLIEKIYTDEAYTIYAGDTNSISHEKNIFASFQRTFNYHKQREIRLDMKFKFIERKIDMEMAYDVGYFIIDKIDKHGIKTKGKPGKFVTVLLKQKDGSWKFQIDIYGDTSNAAFQ